MLLSIKRLINKIEMSYLFRFGYWINFPFKYAFPSNKILSNWISTLALITNDLILSNRNLIDEFDKHPQKGTPEVSYYLWLTCAHYREAAKYYSKTLKHPEISSFIESLPLSTENQLNQMKNDFEPWDESLLKTIVKPIRDIFIHYPTLDSKDWVNVWGKLDEQFGELHQKGSALGDSRWIFADDIRINLIDQRIKETGYTTEKAISLIGNAVVNMIKFSQTVIIEYFYRLPNGIVNRGRKPNIRND
ncbi:MAG: hypothetical protein ABIA75_09485 [Candidatus Neomarinimicrobiota bacterium]